MSALLADASPIRRVAQTWLGYQRRWMADKSRFKIIEKSRRIGADYCEAYDCVLERATGERTLDYWYSSADESAAQEFMVYVREACELIQAVTEYTEDVDPFGRNDLKVMTVTMPEVGGRRPRITAMTSNPKSMRSKGGDVCLSEFAFHECPEEMYKAAMPVVTLGGRLKIISSHNGQGEFLRKLEGARRRSNPAVFGEPRHGDVPMSVHRVTIDDAIADGLVDLVNRKGGTDYTPEAWREEMRLLAGDERTWREEFLCEPSSDNDSYFPFDLLRQCARHTDHAGTDPAPTSDPLELVEQVRRAVTPERGGVDRYDHLLVGSDIGRTKDAFTVWVLGVRGGMKRTVGALAVTGLSFSSMESVIAMIMRAEFGAVRVRRACVDATGLGMQLAERLTQRFHGRVEGVTISARVKEQLFTAVRRDLEERTVTIPDDPRILGELNGIRRVVTAAGNARFDLERNADGHGDLAMGLALAIHAGEGGTRFGTIRLPRGVL